LIEIGPVVLEKNILKIFFVYFYSCYYLPLEKGAALHFNKLESPHPKDNLCQVWLKLAQWFGRRRFLNIFTIFLLSPLREGRRCSFEQT
jgi:hypothetical protein